jgi:hypothetical protein
MSKGFHSDLNDKIDAELFVILSPCEGILANSDNFIDTKPKATADLNQPPRCPKCRSTETSSAAKKPTANSYWRCLKCGDVWNPSLLPEPKHWGQR